MPGFLKIVNNYPSIDVGKMRHRVTILAQQPTGEYDSAGPQFEWLPVVTEWAAIEFVRGTDVIKSGQSISQAYLTVGMWYQDGILANMRVQSEGGSTYVIQSIENPLEANVCLILNCVGIGPND